MRFFYVLYVYVRMLNTRQYVLQHTSYNVALRLTT